MTSAAHHLRVPEPPVPPSRRATRPAGTVRLRGAESPRGREDVGMLPGHALMVGRDRELEALRQAFADVEHGASRAFVV